MVESDFVDTEKKVIGPIDALTSGLALIARRPWAVLLPVGLQFLTWLGPRLTVAPLAQQAADELRSTAALQTGQYAEWVQAQAQTLSDIGAKTNLLDLLAVGIPALALDPKGAVTWSLDNAFVAAALTTVILAVGVVLLSVYLLIIAHLLRDDDFSLGTALARSGQVAWRLIAAGVVLLGIATLIAMPAMVGIGLLSLFSSGGAAILSSLLLWGGLLFLFWLLFYSYFVVYAIVLDGVGLRQALSRSVVLVRQNSGSTLGLILLTLLLSVGLGQVWITLAKTTVGTVASILGNAYISTGLVAAGLIFYRSRWSALQKQLRPLAPASPKETADSPDHLDE